jgi:hypothetical protein
MTTTDPLDILIQAIAAKWAATSALSTIAGPWRGERATDAAANPASGTMFPYCVIPDDRGSPSIMFTMSCGNEYWRHEIKFRIYSTTEAAAAIAGKLVDDVFRPASLSLSLAAGSLLKNRHIRIRYVKEDNSTWYCELTYEFETSRPVA